MKRPETSDDAKNATTQCGRNFACLQDDGRPRCQMAECVNHAVYFVACLSDSGCPYAKSFGRGHLCSCPVRKDLFNRFGR